MQHLFVEAASPLERTPQPILQGSSLVDAAFRRQQDYKLFDESYEVLLEVVEDGLFTGGVRSFIDGGLIRVILGLVDACEVVGLLDMLGGRVAVQECLFVKKLLNGVLLKAQVIQVEVVLLREHFLAISVIVDGVRHIFVIFGICIAKHYNSIPHELEFAQCFSTSPRCGCMAVRFVIHRSVCLEKRRLGAMKCRSLGKTISYKALWMCLRPLQFIPDGQQDHISCGSNCLRGCF